MPIFPKHHNRSVSDADATAHCDNLRLELRIQRRQFVKHASRRLELLNGIPAISPAIPKVESGKSQRQKDTLEIQADQPENNVTGGGQWFIYHYLLLLSSIAHFEVLPMANNRENTQQWLPHEEAMLCALFDDGLEAGEIAARRGRSRQSIYERVQRFRKQQGRTSRTSGRAFTQWLSG